MGRKGSFSCIAPPSALLTHIVLNGCLGLRVGTRFQRCDNMDEGTKSTVSKLPLLTVRASPRDKEAWTARLKEELTALIQVSG